MKGGENINNRKAPVTWIWEELKNERNSQSKKVYDKILFVPFHARIEIFMNFKGDEKSPSAPVRVS
jgi:hypothetical protein